MSEPLVRGATLGRYVVLDVVGRGGMGVVYAAYDPELDRKIAIKVLRQGSRESSEASGRLLREAQAMARLSHPNVVAVHDVGTFEGSVFVAMDFIEGKTLKAWLDGEGKDLSWRERLDVLESAGRGLAAAHAAGLVHRDFKPENVLVGNDGKVLVTDFGIARSVSSRESRREAPRSSGSLGEELTETGSILGTIGYMAPEQASSGEVDARSDQFGFCATLYLALYGDRPFSSKNLEAYIESLYSPLREPPSGSKVPAWLRQVVARGLHQRPEERFPSMDALLLALSRDPARARRRWIIAAVVASCALVGVLVARDSLRRKALVCTQAVPSLSGVWNDDVKREARASFDATTAPRARESFDRAAKVLDAYATDWRSMYVQACEATWVHAEQPEDVRRLRADCLDRQKDELRALTTLFRHADAQVVDSSINAAYGLPPLSWCADVKSLRANVGLPDDPVKRARVEEARRNIAEANALALGDKNKEAIAAAEHAVDLARAASSESAEAEALYVVGDAQMRLVDAAAERSLASATWAGLSSGQYAIAVRASATLAYIVGVDLQRRSEAYDWLARAKALLRKSGGSDELEALVAWREAALIQSVDHRPERALPISQDVVRRYRRLFGDHPDTERALLNLGNVHEALGHDDLALTTYQEAFSMSVRLYGEESLRTGVATAHVGDAHLKLGHIDEGVGLLERALGVFERVGNAFWTIAVLQELTQSANRFGRPGSDQALAMGQRGLALLEHAEGTAVLVPASCVTTADALLALGRASEARALCERGLAAEEKASTVDPEKVYEWDALRCQGEALLVEGRGSEALGSLERSVTLTRREWPGDLALARFGVARALVATRGDAGRARSLAKLARDELAARPELKGQLTVLEAWLASHP